jgi:hypothetical protein
MGFVVNIAIMVPSLALGERQLMLESFHLKGVVTVTRLLGDTKAIHKTLSI